MPIVRKQVVSGGTASIKFTIQDFDTLASLVADTLPTVDIYDPRRQQVVTAQQSTAIGGGVYVYNYPTTSSNVKGNYRVTFTYTIQDISGKEDGQFQVI
jgi:hypothetical protein